MKHDENFSTDTLDVHGKPAPIWAIGTHWRHSRNGKTYVVFMVTWMGATDEWGVTMRDREHAMAVAVTRPEHHLLGVRSNGEQRYQRID